MSTPSLDQQCCRGVAEHVRRRHSAAERPAAAASRRSRSRTALRLDCGAVAIGKQRRRLRRQAPPRHQTGECLAHRRIGHIGDAVARALAGDAQRRAIRRHVVHLQPAELADGLQLPPSAPSPC